MTSTAKVGSIVRTIRLVQSVDSIDGPPCGAVGVVRRIIGDRYAAVKFPGLRRTVVARLNGFRREISLAPGADLATAARTFRKLRAGDLAGFAKFQERLAIETHAERGPAAARRMRRVGNRHVRGMARDWGMRHSA